MSHSMPLLRRRSTGSQSGSDHETTFDVPSIRATLDNSVHMDLFKKEVLIFIHRLKLPRWRAIPFTEAPQITITRISGALTNAVYCVSPPPKYLHHGGYRNLPHVPMETLASKGGAKLPGSQMAPIHVPLLLLRVYGPNTSQIIDRDSELALLKRLASRKIGPRILGIFTNGRFEQYLKSTVLTKEDIRIPETSSVIAKRMRELHDGIDLTLEERIAGPGVWKNFNKWLPDAKHVLLKLDQIAKYQTLDPNGVAPPWTSKSILRADWNTFLEGAYRYIDWLEIQTGGASGARKKLVFAHNDTQYGNLLRVDPPVGSPLLLPVNEHKTLVVIDFEYASPNVRAYDIVNHFCEWMCDYHDPKRPQDLRSERYPSDEDCFRFVESYVTHNIDSYENMEAIDAHINELLKEVLIWRPAVSLGWTLWGIISTTLPPEAEEDADGFIDIGQATGPESKSADAAVGNNQDGNIMAADPFDYLDYASQKASLFWGDMETLGIPIPDGVDMDKAMYIGKPWKWRQ
ncbi:kinase-like domain-containing protein [Lipomyces oligophaga]|uniref:kinase-like domain-containing protein n=1 Tax=Lipomyces oligophaga TaxID=45792 RepID=UPI0034CD6DCB